MVIAAGPSLERQINELRGLNDDVLLVAVEAAAPYLFEVGVIPHIVITAEEQANSAVIFQRLEGWFPMVSLCASTTASPLGLHLCRELGAKVYFYNNNHPTLTHRHQSNLLPKNVPSLIPMCGSITFHAVALAGKFLEIHEVALVGADFQATNRNKTHAGRYIVDSIPLEAINAAFDWHQRELEMNVMSKAPVWNCTDISALKAIKRKKLSEFLDGHYRRKPQPAIPLAQKKEAI